MATVAIISSYAPSLVRFRGNLIRTMTGRGHRVVAFAPEAEAPDGFETLNAEYRPWQVRRTGISPAHDLHALRALTSDLRALAPTVALAYTMKPVAYGMLAAARACVPRRYALVTGLGYLFSPDGTLRDRCVRAASRPLLRAALTCASEVFVQNDDDAHDLRAFRVVPRDKPIQRFWGSGVPIDAFPQRPVPRGSPTFCFVGRLLREKGVRELVAAAAIVRSRAPDARVLLVGPLDSNPTGVGVEEVRRWVDEGVVEVHGPQSDVLPYLQGSSVFVLPSYREGTPRSVLEAMSTGRAVITTDVPGCRDTVRDGDNGFLVPAKSAEALAEAMLAYVADPALAVHHGRRGRAIAEERYDVNKVSRAMLAAMQL